MSEIILSSQCIKPALSRHHGYEVLMTCRHSFPQCLISPQTVCNQSTHHSWVGRGTDG